MWKPPIFAGAVAAVKFDDIDVVVVGALSENVNGVSMANVGGGGIGAINEDVSAVGIVPIFDNVS